MIKGLTEGESLKGVGNIRKGAPKPKSGNRPGRDLDHFRFTSDQDDVLDAFNEAYGPEPKQIDVFLTGETVEATGDFWMEEYVSGGLTKRCDGETLHLHRNPREADYSEEERPCQSPHCNCKETGRLYVLVPAIERFGEVCVHTTSKHDIRNLATCIRTYQRLCERAGISLSMLPLTLCRTPMNVSVPTDNGRTRMEKHLVTLEPRRAWVRRAYRQLNRQAMALPAPGDAAAGDDPERLSGNERLQLPEANVVDVEGSDVEGPEDKSARERADHTRRDAEIDMTGAPPTFMKEAQVAATDYGFADRDRRLEFTSLLVGYDLGTYKELTAEECDYVVRALDWLTDQLESDQQRTSFTSYACAKELDLTDPRKVGRHLDEYRGRSRPFGQEDAPAKGDGHPEGDAPEDGEWETSAFDPYPDALQP